MPKRRPDHQPQRTCAVCRTVRAKREMQRIVRLADGTTMTDASGRMPGRGTCLRRSNCQANPNREKAIARALGIEVTRATA